MPGFLFLKHQIRVQEWLLRAVILTIAGSSLCPLSGFGSDTVLIQQQYEHIQELVAGEDYYSAEKEARSALKEIERWSNPPLDLYSGLISVLGDCALEAGNYLEALEYYERTRQLIQQAQQTDTPIGAELFNKLGNYYLETKDYEQARIMLDRALEIRKRFFGDDHLKVADSYNNIGICLNALGDFGQAVDFHRQALRIRQNLLSEPHVQIAQSFNNLGLCFQNMEDYPAALEAYEQALVQYQSLDDKADRYLANTYLNIGTVYGAVDDMQQYFAYHDKAYAVWQRILPPNHPSLALYFNNMANGYSALEDFEQASVYYRRALAIEIELFGEIHPDVAMTYYNIGLNRYFAGYTRSAVEAFLKSFHALNYQPGSSSSFEDVNDHSILLQLFGVVNLPHIEAYYESGREAFLLQAFSYFQQADRLIDFLRERYETIGSKLRLADVAHDLYGSAIELALSLHELSQDNQYLHQAFVFSEKSKGILLLEAFLEEDAEFISGIPAEVTRQLQTIEAGIRELEKRRFLLQQAPQQVAKRQIDSISQLIFEEKQERSGIIHAIQRQYPQYYQLRFETATVPVAVIQESLLQPGQAILEYFLGYEHVHLFVIRSDTFFVESIALPEKFYEWLVGFNNSIRRFPYVSSKEFKNTIQEYIDIADSLHQSLIRPVTDQLSSPLLIIPDGELGYLSFGALLSAKPENANNFRELPYLEKDFSISYNYSATLFQEMLQRKPGKLQKPYLGLAPEFRPTNKKGLSALHYNQEEVQTIVDLLGGEFLLGPKATKSVFLQLQANYKIVHLATHGKANNTTGDYSFLAFSENAGHQGEEALLYVKEIYNMHTQTEMVVLSACETGIGELQRGEGIASIARSFSYAGARSLIATQWSIDDKATNQLIQLFFKNIKAGMPKDQAMQQAKLTFIANNGNATTHPYYWASFIAVGNMEPVELEEPTGWPVWVLAGLAVLSIGLGLGIYQRRLAQHI